MPDKVEVVTDVVYYIVLIIAVLSIFLEPTAGFYHKRYRINEESVEYIEGIFFVKRTIVPVRRMQQV